jgi:tRNA U34 2-thiouridine synthase MnmA/TrmU
LGLRTWDKPDSQDVCFIEASKGRTSFLGQRIEFTPAKIIVGQRRGVLPGRDGQKRYVAKVDIRERRIEVGRIEDVLVSTLPLDSSSLTFSHEPLKDGSVVLAQWSAHGTAREATLREGEVWTLELREPQRPVASGQSVVFYRVDEPTIVEGAAIVAPS